VERFISRARAKFRRVRNQRRKAAAVARRRAEFTEQKKAAGKARAAGDLDAELEATRRIVELRPRRARNHYRLGRILELMERYDEAEKAFHEGLDRDRRSRPIDYAMLDARPRRFMSRRRLGRFVDEHREAILEAYRASGEPEPRRPDTVHVFVFWAQGFDQAPPVVRMCRDQLLALHEPGVVVCLDSQTLSDWVELPDHVVEAGSGMITQYSDLVRAALLARHGGIWVDATVLVTTELTSLYDTLTPTGFFAPTYRAGGIASWVMASEQHGYIVSIMRETELLYWNEPDAPKAYFKFHQMFEAQYLLDERFAASFDGMPTVSPHLRRLHGLMRQPYAPKRLRRVLGKSFVHKLTYKRKGAEVDPATETGTNLAYLLEHGVPEHDPFVWDEADLT
jgi:hypothetical protein